MPGESDLHKTLKKEACRWLYRMGYRAIAAEVRVKPLGIIDAVGTGIFRARENFLGANTEVPQACFIECKASRADFLRDWSNDGQLSLCMMERGKNLRHSVYRNHRRQLDQAVGLGKFHACIAQPLANIHYILAPQGVVAKKDLPPRWGLLTLGECGITTVVAPTWQEAAHTHYIDSAIARTLTLDIHRADDRAISSVNRELFAQQQMLARRIRQIKQHVVLAPERRRKEPAETAMAGLRIKP